MCVCVWICACACVRVCVCVCARCKLTFVLFFVTHTCARTLLPAEASLEAACGNASKYIFPRSSFPPHHRDHSTENGKAAIERSVPVGGLSKQAGQPGRSSQSELVEGQDVMYVDRMGEHIIAKVCVCVCVCVCVSCVCDAYTHVYFCVCVNV